MVADKSGNGNNGTVSSPSWTTAGKFGSALTFSTSARRVVIADANSLDLTTGMTLEAWVYPTATLKGWSTVIMKEQPGEFVYALYASGDSSKQYGTIYSGGAERETSGGGQLTANTWTHLAATYNGSTIKVYKNGTLLGSYNYSGAILTSTGALDIGGNSVWGEYFNGRIDEVRVYNRELIVSEIISDMNTPIE